MVFVAGVFASSVSAATFTEFTVRPSRIETSATDVNFLIKLEPASTATEDAINVIFGTGYTVDGTASNITVNSTLGTLQSWDAECDAAVPSIGATAASVAGQTASFASGDLDTGTTYCFLITAGVDNPSSTGNYPMTVETEESSAIVDYAIVMMPAVDDDEVVITAAVAPFVRCDVDTTAGTNNSIDLGVLQYGTVTSSSTLDTPDNIRVYGGTNASEGMTWYYRSDASFNGLRSTTGSYTLTGADAEGTLSATTANCAGGTPCYGIYYSGTSSTVTGSITVDTDYTGLTATTAVGPMRTDIWGDAIASSSAAVAGAEIVFNVNATASEQAPAAVDYTDTLIFTCKADL
ncbi:MAG: hypothetical protein QY314_01760 [Candidatus Dojkabacteria bacterium]|nr:MAG: hypothetical protein QY314_01760 [Candidatus Dojkabacteria bacterium]